jgi:hypothetical protein
MVSFRSADRVGEFSAGVSASSSYAVLLAALSAAVRVVLG